MSAKESICLYHYLDDPRARLGLSLPTYGPLSVTREKEPWKKLLKDIQPPNAHDIDTFLEEGYTILAGTINLIHIIEAKYQEGNPIETLLFLDKSGRLASHVLRKTYQYIEAHLGDEGKRLAARKPNIRYINVGLSEDMKHNDAGANSLLSRVYPHTNLKTGSTLIVDEIMISGTSARRAGESIETAGYAKEAMAVSQFDTTPVWYRHEYAKGVDDVGDIHVPTRVLMSRVNRLAPERIDEAIHMIGKYGWRNLIRAFDSFEADSVFIPKEAIDCIASLASFGAPSDFRPNQVIRYLASRGGFLALSPNKNQKTGTRAYRTNLDNLVAGAFERNLVKLRSDAFYIITRMFQRR